MNDYAGESGGGSSAPQPNIEFEAVEMDTASLKAFGDALIKDAENLKAAAKTIGKDLKDPTGEYGLEADYPVGADPRQETLHDLMVTHSLRMVDTNTYLENAETAIRNLGIICKYISDSIGDVDALNGVSIDRVKSVIDETKPSSNNDDSEGV